MPLDPTRRLAKQPYYQVYIAVTGGEQRWMKVGVSDHVSLRAKKLNKLGGYGTHRVHSNALHADYHRKKRVRQSNLSYSDVDRNYHRIEWSILRCFSLPNMTAREAGEIEHAIHVAFEHQGLLLSALASEEEAAKSRRADREPRPARCLEIFQADTAKAAEALRWLADHAARLRYGPNLNRSIGRYRGYKQDRAQRLSRLSRRLSKLKWGVV